MDRGVKYDPRISGEDFDFDDELDYCEDCPNSDGTPCYECTPAYPDLDRYCPKCGDVMTGNFDGMGTDLCNHCGYKD